MELIREAPTERMTFEDGSWVDLKTRLTLAERGQLRAGAVSMVVDEDGKARPVVDVGGVDQAALNLGVMGWSLDAPVTPENIGILDDESGARIKARLDELWSPRTDDERKNSSGGGAPRSAEKGEFQTSSGG